MCRRFDSVSRHQRQNGPHRGPFCLWRRRNRSHCNLRARFGGWSTHCVRKPKAPLDCVRPGGGAGAPEEGIPSGMGGARTRFDAPEPRTAWRQEGSGLSTRAARGEAPLPRAAGDREDARGASDKREARERRGRGFRRGWTYLARAAFWRRRRSFSSTSAWSWRSRICAWAIRSRFFSKATCSGVRGSVLGGVQAAVPRATAMRKVQCLSKVCPLFLELTSSRYQYPCHG